MIRLLILAGYVTAGFNWHACRYAQTEREIKCYKEVFAELALQLDSGAQLVRFACLRRTPRDSCHACSADAVCMAVYFLASFARIAY